MKRLLLALVLVLSACREEEAKPDPVALTPEATGYFCQMNLMEHAGPKAQAHLEGLPGMPLFFSQVRDVVAFERMPERDNRIVAIYVNDMGVAPSWEDPGTTNWIDAEKAVYVVGSTRMGAMEAPEFVPFADPARAAAFATQFGGKVMPLAEIPDSAVFPDEGSAGGDDADYAARLRALAPKTGD